MALAMQMVPVSSPQAPWGTESTEALVLEGFAPTGPIASGLAPAAQPGERRPSSREFRWFLKKLKALICSHPDISPEDVWLRWRRGQAGADLVVAVAIRRPGQAPWRFRAHVTARGREGVRRRLRAVAWEFRRRLLRNFPLELSSCA